MTETTLHRTRLHWGVFVFPLLPLVISLLPTLPFLWFSHQFTSSMGVHLPAWIVWMPVSMCAVAAVPLLLVTYLSFAQSEIVLTTQRLKFQVGILVRRSGEIQLDRVESVFLAESLLGRVLGYGTVMVVGTGGTPFRLDFLPEAETFHWDLKRSVEAARHGGQSPPSGGSEPAPPDDSPYMPKG